MKVAIVCSNLFNITRTTKKGTEIILYDFIHEISRRSQSDNLELTAFASGDSDLPVAIESVSSSPSSEDKDLMQAGKHFIFELALIAKAISMESEFDLYHINIGDGDIFLPFAQFTKKPILITIYHPANAMYVKKYVKLFQECKNIFFISPTKRHQAAMSELSFLKVIPHGINTRSFTFDAAGGQTMMWAGRAMPDKGMNIAIDVAKETGNNLRMFGIVKDGYEKWLNETVLHNVDQKDITLEINKDRLDLVNEYQMSKLFLFPLQWEEPFGLVLVESMSCGTPVVAYAKGSIPEIIKDGVTGFIVNESEDDIRGDWIIKKTGIEGLKEAVKKIYAMPNEEYLKMRKACRERVREHFSIDVMTQNYIQAYKDAIALSSR